MAYSILEANMERLEKKLTRIQNKCKKFGCSFTYEKVGEEFKTLKDDRGVEYQAKFILIEAEGKAVLNDWMFVASVQHTEKGNIINSTGCSIEVPERYYTSEPICEHCNSRRARKDTYIVMNQITGEFKQVGKSCLKDFTNGMDAAMILLLGIPVKVMKEKYGWGMKKRLPEFCEAMIDVYTDFQNGDMTLEEFADLIYQECGVKFQKNE